MNIRSRIRQNIERTAGHITAEDVRIGLGYTAVKLANGRTGVAYTFREPSFSGCSVFFGIRPLAGRPLSDLLAFLDSSDRIESAVGLAAANAAANVTPKHALPGDVLEGVQLLPSDRVAMIGFFGPLIPHLKERVHDLEIFEEDPDMDANTRPASEAPERLMRCNVAFITATTIVNNTIDALLDAARNCRAVVVLGSSTPLLPEVFGDTPVTCLSGIVVEDPAGMLQVVSEGGGTRFFKPFVKKWNVPVKESS